MTVLASDANLIRDPHEALEQHFGFGEFLDGQEAVVTSLLTGKDTLAVMPTGGGKSLCYQLPAMVMEGVTLVISPLIALMKDQVDGLVRKGIPATMINSTLSPGEQSERLRELAAEKGKRAFLVDGPQDLSLNDFNADDRVVVTAGASAPESVVEATVNWLLEHFDGTVETKEIREESVRFPLPKPLRSVAAEVTS